MLKDKKVLFVVLAILIIARTILVFIEEKKDQKEEQKVAATKEVLVTDTEEGTHAQSKKDNQKTIFVPTSDDECAQNKKEYISLEDVKKKYRYSERFFNIHKKIDGDVYRLRFFYRESAENEIPTYLLYKEDQNDEEHIIEKSSYKKGPQYAEIEKAQGEVIYREEGLTTGMDQDFFIHYENGELKTLQGKNPLKLSSVPIECHF